MVSTVMTKDVVAVKRDVPLKEAVSLMRSRRLSCVVVVEGRKPVGMVTERDVVRVLCDYLSSGGVFPSTVGEVMSWPVLTVNRGTPLSEAVFKLMDARIRHFPVVDDGGGLCGIVTQTDLLRSYADMLSRQQEYLESVIRERTRQLQEANERLRLLSMQDPLLGIGNRRAMEVALQQVHEDALRDGRGYAVAIFDVDFFKRYNDTYGHPAGDVVLMKIAECMKDAAGGNAFRYGGEEMLVLFPGTDADGAVRRCEALRRRVESLGISHLHGIDGVVTVSAGVAEVGKSCGSWREVVERADAALLEAKRRGRNRVMCASP